MTAEALAESLQKPIYPVSVGELGITPDSMEENLTKVMDIAASWDAVVLLDEVDIFAIKRNNADIQRNAMTAILLRVLERFGGILFMTTNLKDNLDDAFISRATASISYPDLTAQAREKIWLNLLSKAKNSGVEIDPKLIDSIGIIADSYSLNGRTIKNKIRLAYTLAMSKDKTITKEIVDSVLHL